MDFSGSDHFVKFWFFMLVIHLNHLYTLSGKLVSISILGHIYMNNAQGNSNDFKDNNNAFQQH